MCDPHEEEQRLALLRQYEILGTDPERTFDDLTELAAQVCATQAAFICFIDRDRVWVKSRTGPAGGEIPRSGDFCSQVLARRGIFFPPDRDGESLPRIIAAVPLVEANNCALGALCVADDWPRDLSEAQKSGLETLGRQVVAQLELRRTLIERRRAEEQVGQDAFHDPLTGLPNRALFLDHLKLAVERAKRREGNHLFAVLFLDLDRFKVVNDSLGHNFGDQLLITIARRLESCLRPGDTVARLGGDEFTMLLDDIKDASDAIRLAKLIQEVLRLPFNLDGHEVFTTVSIGIALSATDYDHPEDLLRDADTAMYRAKSLGKARHEVFDKPMHARAMELLQLEIDLRRACERQEFCIHYQPIVSLETGRISGFEALVRWKHPERGLITPEKFIPVAEETGLIVPIGQLVLGEACRQMRRWQRQFPPLQPLSISVNLSSKQLTQPDLIEQIKQSLQRSGLDPLSLKLEITESVMMENTERVINMLTQLRALQVGLSIDDFGTGYSSLSYLHRFPVGTLKIDRSFVNRLGHDDENGEIVKTIIMLAQNLKMEVVAEGVETDEQLLHLRNLRCDYAQGFLISKPVDAETAAKLLQNRMERFNSPYAPYYAGEGVRS